MISAPAIRVAALSAALALPLVLLAATPAAAATVNVRDQVALQNAFLVNGNTVVLSENITFPAGQSLSIDASESITLDLNGFTLIIPSPPGDEAAIRVGPTSGLTINATGGGIITAAGGSSGAGIGGSDSEAGGTITINGGTITATGGLGGAGIGGGADSDGGTITINGGTITATGGSEGAGIGGAGMGGGSILRVNGTPAAGAATTGGNPTTGSNASTITNALLPPGVGYSATTTSPLGGRIVLLFNYLVTFTATGGSTTADQTINYDGTVTDPGAPTREGFTFSGWESSGSRYDFSTRVREPLTLTATWTAVPGETTPSPARPGSELAATRPGSELAATGADVNPALGVATLLVAGGITLIALRRRATTRST